MASLIIPMRKNLKYIYISHFHPDHHFGLKALCQAFPNAKVVGLARGPRPCRHVRRQGGYVVIRPFRGRRFAHDCHLWPIESNVRRRVKWRKDIARMMDFDPRIVIPGHCDEAKIKILEEAAEDGSRSYTDCVDWSVKYLETYDEVYDSAKNGKELVDMMFGPFLAVVGSKSIAPQMS
jgi:glyoxylase-like metal-dependent hydrolase (beta-lactamase superfamily II)